MTHQKEEFLHSWYVLIITFFSLLFLLINRGFALDFILSAVVFFIYFKNGLEFSKFRKLFFYAFVFSFSIFVLNILHPAKDFSTNKAFKTMLRLFLVSLLSMTSGSIIDYTKVILHLIVHKGLRLFWGYPMLLAMNSISLFKKEYERIKINAKLRGLPFKDRLSIFFPLLVFAIRHSQRGALSLVTRGLNQEKSFYFSYDVSVKDKKRLFSFWLFYFGLVSMAYLQLR